MVTECNMSAPFYSASNTRLNAVKMSKISMLTCTINLNAFLLPKRFMFVGTIPLRASENNLELK